MASFNAELVAKVLERRVNSLESQVDGINKASRAAGDNNAAVTALQKQVADQKLRIENLEKLVKTLVESRGDSKSVALEKLEKAVVEIDRGRKAERESLVTEFHKAAAESFKHNVITYHLVQQQDVTKLIDEQITRASKDQSTIYEARLARLHVDQERSKAAALAEAKREFEAEMDRAMKIAARQQQDAAERMTKALVDTQVTMLSARIGAIESTLKKL